MAFLYMAAEYQIRLHVIPEKKIQPSRTWRGTVWGAYNTSTGLFAPGVSKEQTLSMSNPTGPHWEKLSNKKTEFGEWFVLKCLVYKKICNK